MYECDFKTVSNGKLKRHIRKVHEDEQEICVICNIIVKHAYHHVRTAHKDKPNAWQEIMDRKREVENMFKSKEFQQGIKPIQDVVEDTKVSAFDLLT